MNNVLQNKCHIAEKNTIEMFTWVVTGSDGKGEGLLENRALDFNKVPKKLKFLQIILSH